MTVNKTGAQPTAEPMPDYSGLIWTIVIENRSAEAVTVQFVDQLPGDTFGTPVVSPATVVYNPGAQTLTWNGTLRPGGSITITVNIILPLGNPPQCRTVPNPSYTVTVNGVAYPPVTNSAPVQIGPCEGTVTATSMSLSGEAIKWADELETRTSTASAATPPPATATLNPTSTFAPPPEPTAAPPTAPPATAETGTAEPPTAPPATAETGTPEPTTAPPATAETGTPEPTTAPPATTETGTPEPTTAPPATTERGTSEPTTAPPATEAPTQGPPATETVEVPELPRPTEAVGPYPAPPAGTDAPAVTAPGFGGGALAPYILVATVILALFRRR